MDAIAAWFEWLGIGVVLFVILGTLEDIKEAIKEQTEYLKGEDDPNQP